MPLRVVGVPPQVLGNTVVSVERVFLLLAAVRVADRAPVADEALDLDALRLDPESDGLRLGQIGRLLLFGRDVGLRLERPRDAGEAGDEVGRRRERVAER